MAIIAVGGEELAAAVSCPGTGGAPAASACPAPAAKHSAKDKTPALKTAMERRGGFTENAPFDLL
jgi:hypothetical protein